MSDSLATRRTQVAVALEAIEGTPETFVDADARMTVVPTSVNYTPDVNREPRDPARESYTPLPSIVGRQASRLAFEAELKGSGDVTVAPSFSKALQACGLKEYPLAELPIGAIAGGPVPAGAIVTGGTSGATALVVASATDGDANLLVIDVTGGPFQAEALTFSTSAATVSSTGAEVADRGFTYRPISTGIPSATVARYRDGTKFVVPGARGNLRITCPPSMRCLLGFDFLGSWVDPVDEAMLSPTYETTDPPAFKGAELTLDDGHKPCYGNLNVDLGNTLSLRECSGHPAGVTSTYLSNRTPTGDFDPEMVLVATHDFYGRFIRADLTGIEARWGTTAGNRFILSLPRCQYDAPSDGDAEGRWLLSPQPFDLVGADVNGGDDELFLTCY